MSLHKRCAGEKKESVCTKCFETELIENVTTENPELLDVVKDYTDVLKSFPKTNHKCIKCGSSMRLYSNECRGKMKEFSKEEGEDSETELMKQVLDYELENLFGSEPVLN